MAKNCWLVSTVFAKENFYDDYATNKDKRFQSGQCPDIETFWAAYLENYGKIRDNGELIIRAKLINSDNITLIQIYASEKSRLSALKDVPSTMFHDAVESVISEESREISVAEAEQIIQHIANRDNRIIQDLRPDFWHAAKGCTIGDPLKPGGLIHL